MLRDIEWPSCQCRAAVLMQTPDRCLAVDTRRSLHLLKEIKRRERMVAKLYRHVLRTLARMQWKADTDRHHLPQQLKVLLAAVKDNLSDFDRNLELAIIAHEQHNQPLLMGSLERLLALEERALQHAEQLRRVMERMSEGTSATPRAA